MSEAHFGMASDVMAGDAKRRVPVPNTQAKNRRFSSAPREYDIVLAAVCWRSSEQLAGRYFVTDE
ncbi:MAG: hypothetical protein IJ567_08130 [Lachnospiraceae bacterium]|nr:hypothetical protein [Lachnospiraceae bacterium]